MIKGYNCPICKDLRFVYKDVHPGHPDFGRAIVCECRQLDTVMRRRTYLTRIDGLTPDERQRHFENYDLTPGNQAAYDYVFQVISARRGMVTLTGKHGRGKSELLICAINAARNAGIPAVYAKAADVLDYLRKAYKPGAELDIDERWELLTSVEVLAIDEMDKFYATEWAIDRFSRLIDERWRNIGRALTLFATNAAVEQLPGNIASRLKDGRGKIICVTGEDVRPVNDWDE